MLYTLPLSSCFSLQYFTSPWNQVGILYWKHVLTFVTVLAFLIRLWRLRPLCIGSCNVYMNANQICTKRHLKMRAFDQFITGHGHFATKFEHTDYCSYHHHHRLLLLLLLLLVLLLLLLLLLLLPLLPLLQQRCSMWKSAYLKNWIFDNVTVIWLQAMGIDRLNIRIMCCKRTNAM